MNYISNNIGLNLNLQLVLKQTYIQIIHWRFILLLRVTIIIFLFNSIKNILVKSNKQYSIDVFLLSCNSIIFKFNKHKR